MQEISGENGEYIEPIGLVRLIPMFRNAWKSPVFQRHLKDHKDRNFVKPIYALYIGFGVAIAIGSILGTSNDPHLGMHSMYTATVIAPSIIAIIICMGKLMAPIFIITPLRIMEIVSSDEFDPLIMTPLTDEEIFIPEALTPVLINQKVIEETVLFIIGLNIGSLFDIFYWAQEFREVFRNSEIYYVFIIGFILAAIINFVLILIHLALASSISGLFYPIPVSILPAIIRVIMAWLISLITAIMGSYICLFLLWFYLDKPGFFDGLVPFWTVPLQVVVFGLMVKMHANEGVREFSKRRRNK